MKNKNLWLVIGSVVLLIGIFLMVARITASTRPKDLVLCPRKTLNFLYQITP